jgi:hypothetical protein
MQTENAIDGDYFTYDPICVSHLKLPRLFESPADVQARAHTVKICAAQQLIQNLRYRFGVVLA